MSAMIIGPMLDLVLPLGALLPNRAGPYIGLVFLGFAIGILGHFSRSRWLVVIGVILISLGAFLFPLALELTTDDQPAVRRAR
jgi:hypothetical protein